MPDTYNAAIVGLGFIGGADQVSGDALGQRVEELDGTHFGALSQHSRIELVAGSSRDEGRRQRFAERSGGCRTYADWRELLDREPSTSSASPPMLRSTRRSRSHAPGPELKPSTAKNRLPQTLPDAEAMLKACAASGRCSSSTTTAASPPTSGPCGTASPPEISAISPLFRCNGGRQAGERRQPTFSTQCACSQGRKVEAVSGTLDLAGKPDCRGPAFSDPGGWGMLRLEGGAIVTVDAADYATIPMRFLLQRHKGQGGLRVRKDCNRIPGRQQ